MKSKKFRIIQFLLGIHRIHHLQWSYGYKIAWLPLAYFDNYGIRRTDKHNFKSLRDGRNCRGYHNCTLTGVY